MNVPLSEAQAALLKRMVESGRYGSEAESVDEAFRLLEEENRAFEQIRHKVQEGIAQADRGELIDADEVFARLKRKHEEAFGPQDWRA